MAIGGIAVFVILMFTLILAMRSCGAKCPATCPPGPCEISSSCSKETGYQCVGVQKPGCDVALELKKRQCTGKDGVLVKHFDEKSEECVTDEDPKAKVTLFSTTQRSTAGGSKLRVTTSLDQPFNLKNDEVAININAEQLVGSNLRVKRLEMEGIDEKKSLIVLGEEFIDKPIPSQQVTMKEGLRLDVPGEAVSGKITNVKLNVDLSYDQVSGSTVTPKTATMSLSLTNLQFSWLRPSATYACPTSCDDKDASTRDYCDGNSAPFCLHEAIAGACGNGVCEDTENKCTCPQDCGQCASAGKVTTSSCVEDACTVSLRPDVTVEPVKTSASNSLGKASVTTTLEYNKPFDSKADFVKVTLNVDQRSADVDSISIDKVQLLKSGNVELSASESAQDLGAQGSSIDTTLTIPTQLVEEDMTPQLKVSYTITVKGVETKNSYTQSLQRITVYSGQ